MNFLLSLLVELFAKHKVWFYLIALAAIGGVFFYAGSGYSTLKSDRVIADLKLEHQEELQSIKDANQLALDERQAQINHLQREFAIADQKYLEDMANAKAENDRLIECTKSGDCVQYVKIEGVTCTGSGKDNNQAGIDETAYGRLDKKIAAELYQIAADGDQAIMQLNELQNRVRMLAKVCPIEFI